MNTKVTKKLKRELFELTQQILVCKTWNEPVDPKIQERYDELIEFFDDSSFEISYEI